MKLYSKDGLKRSRLALGLTQSELSKILGVHVMTLSKFERGSKMLPEYADDMATMVQHIGEGRAQCWPEFHTVQNDIYTSISKGHSLMAKAKVGAAVIKYYGWVGSGM